MTLLILIIILFRDQSASICVKDESIKQGLEISEQKEQEKVKKFGRFDDQNVIGDHQQQ